MAGGLSLSTLRLAYSSVPTRVAMKELAVVAPKDQAAPLASDEAGAQWATVSVDVLLNPIVVR